jgi:hypothetical protein
MVKVSYTITKGKYCMRETSLKTLNTVKGKNTRVVIYGLGSSISTEDRAYFNNMTNQIILNKVIIMITGILTTMKLQQILFRKGII